MGVYLAAATLNQAALSAGQARAAAGCWTVAASAFVAVVLVPGFDDRVLQVEVGYTVGAVVLCSLLLRVYRRAITPSSVPGQPSGLRSRSTG